MGWYLFASDIRTDTDLSKMKFLVLALCVCAASAASFAPYKPVTYSNTFPKYGAQAVAQVGSAKIVPVVPASKAVAYAQVPVTPVENVPVAPVVKSYVNTVASAPVAAKNYVSTEGNAEIIRSDADVRPDGYDYKYETSNGISAESSGVVRRVGDTEPVVVQGSYRYTSPEGVPVVFTYVADENGYQPQSDLIPVAPPVPEAIARSLAYIASQPKYVDAKHY